MSEPTTIGLSGRAHQKLQHLKEEGHFEDMQDAYRFAIALALAHGAQTVAETEVSNRTTIFNVGTIDPDGSIHFAVKTLAEVRNGSVYRTAESLAEWGVNELDRMASSGRIPFGQLLAEAEEILRSQGQQR